MVAGTYRTSPVFVHVEGDPVERERAEAGEPLPGVIVTATACHVAQGERRNAIFLLWLA